MSLCPRSNEIDLNTTTTTKTEVTVNCHNRYNGKQFFFKGLNIRDLAQGEYETTDSMVITVFRTLVSSLLLFSTNGPFSVERTAHGAKTLHWG